MDYAKILESLKGLITENTSTEDAEKIGQIANEIEEAKTEHEDTVIKHEELRQKYIKAIQNSAFKDDPRDNPQQTQPLTLEECVKQVIAERK